uniref:Uncharacterized protein n=1 Tax=Anguilla anguilla TaxID=7936 RepID=A0A0E9RFE1_ANGAN
MHTVACDIF